MRRGSAGELTQDELPKASLPLHTNTLLVHLYLQEDDAGNGGMGPR